MINLEVKVERKHLPEDSTWADSDEEDADPDDSIFDEQVHSFTWRVARVALSHAPYGVHTAEGLRGRLRGIRGEEGGADGCLARCLL